MIGGERSAVQDPLIKYATEIGWKYVSQDEALRLRGGKTGFVFKEIFINQMQRLVYGSPSSRGDNQEPGEDPAKCRGQFHRLGVPKGRDISQH